MITLITMKVPVRPTPALQCTHAMPSFPASSCRSLAELPRELHESHIGRACNWVHKRPWQRTKRQLLGCRTAVATAWSTPGRCDAQAAQVYCNWMQARDSRKSRLFLVVTAASIAMRADASRQHQNGTEQDWRSPRKAYSIHCHHEVPDRCSVLGCPMVWPAAQLIVCAIEGLAPMDPNSKGSLFDVTST